MSGSSPWEKKGVHPPSNPPLIVYATTETVNGANQFSQFSQDIKSVRQTLNRSKHMKSMQLFIKHKNMDLIRSKSSNIETQEYRDRKTRKKIILHSGTNSIFLLREN